MTTNPFVSVTTTAGIFAATAGNSDLAERICAGVCGAIQDDASRILDFAWWVECVNTIPKLVASMEGESNLNGTHVSNVLSTLSTVPKLAQKIADASSAIAGLSSLNCFVIEPSGSNMQITLAKLSVDLAKSGDASVTVLKHRYILPIAQAGVLNGLKDIFGDIPPLSNEPYYVSA